jgi:hypothetical protein
MEYCLDGTGAAGATEGRRGSAAGAIATAAQHETQGGQCELFADVSSAGCS